MVFSYFLCRQKVYKNLVIPEGDFCAGGRHKTTAKVESSAQISRFLNFTAIIDRNHI